MAYSTTVLLRSNARLVAGVQRRPDAATGSQFWQAASAVGLLQVVTAYTIDRPSMYYLVLAISMYYYYLDII